METKPLIDLSAPNTIDTAKLLKTPVSVPAPENPIPADVYYDFSARNIIKVKDGKFVRVDASGKEVSFDAVIPEGNDCYGTLFPAEVCPAFKALIEENDPKKILETIASIPVTDFNASKVKSLNPNLAVAILKKFGVPEISVSGKKKFKSVAEWIKQLKDSGVSEVTVKSIDGNLQLKIYLETIIQFVNNNFAVLNSGVLEDKKVEPAFVPEAFKEHLKVLPPIPLVTAKAEDRNALLSLAATAKVARSLFQPTFGIPYGQMMPLPLVGGACVNPATLRSIINSLIEELSRKGKKLRDADKAKIDESLKALEQLDSMLNELAKKLNEFKQWISIAGDTKQEVVDKSSISDSIDKYRSCVAKYANLELGLLNVAEKLSDCK